MKWFQWDSDAPNDPKIKRLLMSIALAGGGHQAARAAHGAYNLVACYVASHGEAEPGKGVTAAGEPLSLKDMATDCWFETEDALRVFLDQLASEGLIEPSAWRDQGVVYLPAMAKRADEYTRKKGRKGRDPVEAPRAEQSPTEPLKNVRTHEPKPAKYPDTTRETGKVSGHNPEKPGECPDTPVLSCTVDLGSGSTPDLLLGQGHQAQAPEAPQQPTDSDPTPTNAQRVVQIWNETVKDPIPKVRSLTVDRARRLKQRLKAHPNLADWRKAIEHMNHVPWMIGQGGGDRPNWVVSIDWLLKNDTNLTRCLEMAAAPKPRRASSGGTGAAPDGAYSDFSGKAERAAS